MGTVLQQWDDSELEDMDTTVIQQPQRLAVSASGMASTQHYLAERVKKILKQNSASELFLKGSKNTYKVGEKFSQPVLAKTLKRL